MPSLHLSVNPFHAIGVVLCPAIKLDRPRVLWTGFLPRVAITKPVICLFNLPVSEWIKQSWSKTAMRYYDMLQKVGFTTLPASLLRFSG